MKELFIVRHGEAEHLVNGSGGGWVDTTLTDLGRDQSRRVGFRLKELMHDKSCRIYSSDLSRASETANIIGGILNEEPTTSSLIRGLSLGIAGNMQKRDAEMIKNPITLPLFDWVPYQDAESSAMMQKRVSMFMDVLYKDRQDTTIIVAHGNSGVSILYWWLRIGRDMLTNLTKPSFQLDPCSLTHVMKDENDRATLVRINDMSHINEG
ncbi:histidine phosphatase family protein [Paenibacillus xylanexedens]|uniref:histidine phosphatase family protein n=1 Tax=Paenibacillus xylanexedens TaxID=528191 RepID=UPI003B020CD3